MRSLMDSVLAMMVNINVAMAGSTCWIVFVMDDLGLSVYSGMNYVVWIGRGVSGIGMQASGCIIVSKDDVYLLCNCSII